MYSIGDGLLLGLDIRVKGRVSCKWFIDYGYFLLSCGLSSRWMILLQLWNIFFLFNHHLWQFCFQTLYLFILCFNILLNLVEFYFKNKILLLNFIWVFFNLPDVLFSKIRIKFTFSQLQWSSSSFSYAHPKDFWQLKKSSMYNSFQFNIRSIDIIIQRVLVLSEQNDEFLYVLVF